MMKLFDLTTNVPKFWNRRVNTYRKAESGRLPGPSHHNAGVMASQRSQKNPLNVVRSGLWTLFGVYPTNKEIQLYFTFKEF